jgi:protein-S-isoprenylcysteine O-methyltransferase Ste14
MPLCAPAVVLHRTWLIGEAVALVLVLIPALCLARWTANETLLPVRAAMLVVLSGGVFLFLLPEIIFATTRAAAWSPFGSQSKYVLGLEFQLIAVLALMGVSAVQEFAARGGGTPIPFDPPKRLVTSGVYRYVANPMQLSCVLVLLAWGMMLRSVWITSAALIGVMYGLGIAGWDERADLDSRFGARYRKYRGAVRAWRIRWRPWHNPEQPSARLYVAESCGPCSEVRRWIEARKPVGLAVVAAEYHPSRELTRITYEPEDVTPSEEGIAAFARALEHLNFAWAFSGFALRLPVFRQLVQLLMDASGMGPQTIRRTEICESSNNQNLIAHENPVLVRIGDWQISSYFWETRLRHTRDAPDQSEYGRAARTV